MANSSGGPPIPGTSSPKPVEQSENTCSDGCSSSDNKYREDWFYEGISLSLSPMIATSHSTGLSYRGYSIQRREKRGTEKSYVMLRKPVAFSAASRCLQTV